MKLLLIANPKSGKKKSIKISHLTRNQLNEKNIDFDFYETKYIAHASEIVKNINLKKYVGIIIIGGDGTFHEIVNGLMYREDNYKVPVGLIPGGSGNSFLYEVSNRSPIKILNEILKFKKKYIDIIEVKTPNEVIYSINLVGWGLVTDIGKSAEKFRWLGTNRYTLTSIIEIIKNKDRNACLTIDGIKNESSFTFIIACNTKYVGKGMFMAPKAKTNDGLLDLIVVKGNLSRMALFRTLPKLFKGTHIDDSNVTYHQVSDFSLITKQNDLLNIDGEMKGSTSIDVKVIHNALEMI